MNISVVIIAFKSDHLLQNLIDSIPNHHEIIVIENSLQTKTKTYLENKFSNTHVVIPEKNPVVQFHMTPRSVLFLAPGYAMGPRFVDLKIL